MNPIFLKEQLLKNKSGIYSELVKKFYEPDISPSMLQSWIANELKVEENLINIKSLTSAINRYRKKIIYFNKIRIILIIHTNNSQYLIH